MTATTTTTSIAIPAGLSRNGRSAAEQLGALAERTGKVHGVVFWVPADWVELGDGVEGYGAELVIEYVDGDGVDALFDDLGEPRTDEVKALLHTLRLTTTEHAGAILVYALDALDASDDDDDE